MNFIIGLITGAVVGYAIACMMVVSSDSERELEDGK